MKEKRNNGDRRKIFTFVAEDRRSGKDRRQVTIHPYLQKYMGVKKAA